MDARKSQRLKVLSLLLFLAAAACLGGSLYLMQSALRSKPANGAGCCSYEDVTEEGDGGGGGGGGRVHHNGNCRQQQQQQQQQQHERPGGDPGGDRGGSVQSPAGARSRNDDDNEDDDDDEDDYPEVFEGLGPKDQGAIALLVVSAALLAGSIAALVLGCRAQRRLPAVGVAVGLAVGGQGKEASAPNVYVVMEEPALDEKQWGLPPPLPAAAAGAVDGGPWAQPVALPSYSEACGVPEGAGQAAP